MRHNGFPGGRRLSRRHIRASFTLVGASLLALLAGCADDAGTASSSTSRKGGDSRPEGLRVGVEADLQGFDPLRTRLMGVSTLSVADAVFDTLVHVRRDGTVAPALATSLTPSDDRLRWRAELRRDVRFHDGTAFDAAAVAAHFQRLLDPANECSCRPFLGPLSRVTAASEFEVLFELESPWAALPAVLGEPSIISLIGSPAALAGKGEDFNRHPVGTGPYRFESWRPGEAVRLARFEQYHGGTDEGVPQYIEYRILPDQQARFAALRAGDVDLIWTVDGATAARAGAMEDLELFRHEGAGARILVFNTRTAPLDDVRVRRALAHASDTAGFIQAVSEGMVAAATEPFGPGSAIECPSTYPAYDPRAAANLLDAYGQDVSVRFSHTATPRGQAAGQIFQQFWQQAGADVTLEPMEQVQLVGSVVRRQFEIGPWRLRDSVDPDADLFGLFHSRSPLNVTGLASPELDALLLATREAPDRDTRNEAFCALERYLSDKVPYVFLGRNTYFAIAGPGVGGEVSLRGGLLGLRDVRLGN